MLPGQGPRRIKRPQKNYGEMAENNNTEQWTNGKWFNNHNKCKNYQVNDVSIYDRV